MNTNQSRNTNRNNTNPNNTSHDTKNNKVLDPARRQALMQAMQSETYKLLRTALQERRPVWAEYKDHIRLICPHILGVKGGKLICLAYQIGGTSSQGPLVKNSLGNWRCFDVELLSNVAVVSKQNASSWYTAHNYKPQSKSIDAVDIHVDAA